MNVPSSTTNSTRSHASNSMAKSFILLPTFRRPGTLSLYLIQKCDYSTEAWGPSGGLYCHPKRGTDVSDMENKEHRIIIMISSPCSSLEMLNRFLPGVFPV